jgi:phosphate:Na+ symporter
MKTSTRYSLLVLLGIALTSLIFLPAMASEIETAHDGIDWTSMIFKLFGGLALFLFGMDQMASALKQVAGDQMKNILAKLTNNRLMGLFTGAFVTAIIQSSSVTTVILVGFVSTGIMSLSQAVGVILGADIGTTITAQIVAFKVTKYALVLVTIGFGMQFLSKKDSFKQYGLLVMGLGLIFYGMSVMSAGMAPLRSFQPFVDLMSSVENPIVGIAVATLFTGLVQSSSATLGVIIALALQGLITLEAGIALALGANIGTCVTAALASIGKSREAIRVAVAHIAFKIIGVLLIVGFIGPFADFIRYISPVDGDLEGTARLAAETPRQIANAHTIFNIAMAFVFLPFLAPFTRMCEWLVPDKPLEEEEEFQPKYLDESLLSTPVFALERARFEIAHMGKDVTKMFAASMPTALTGSGAELEKIADRDRDIDRLYRYIVDYLGKISLQKLSEENTAQLMGMFDLVQQLEQIGDIVESRIVILGLRRISDDIVVSKNTLAKIMAFHKQVLSALELSNSAIHDLNFDAAKQARSMKQDVARLAEDAASHEVARLVADEPNRLATYAIEVEILENLQDIFRRSRRVAKIALSLQ